MFISSKVLAITSLNTEVIDKFIKILQQVIVFYLVYKDRKSEHEVEKASLRLFRSFISLITRSFKLRIILKELTWEKKQLH